MSIYDVPFLDVSVNDDERIFEEAKKVVCQIKTDWNLIDISCKLFKDGCTNKLVACFKEDDNGTDVTLVRVYGKGSGLVIDRNQEKLSMFVLHNLGLSPPLHCSFQNGLVYGYAPGTTLDQDTLYDFDVQRLVMKEMIRFHSIDIEKVQNLLGCKTIFQKAPGLFPSMRKWLDHVPTTFKLDGKWTRQSLRLEVDLLEKELTACDSPIVFCHNDLLPKNIIYEKSHNKVTFIDYEYAQPNYQAFDIGNYFCEFAGMTDIDYDLYPSKEYQMKWLRMFLTILYEQRGKTEVSQSDVDLLYIQANKFSLASHVFWSLWGIIQSQYSNIEYDFVDFARQRLHEYERRKAEFLSLQLAL